MINEPPPQDTGAICKLLKFNEELGGKSIYNPLRDCDSFNRKNAIQFMVVVYWLENVIDLPESVIVF